MATRIGFLGLGRMGLPMAINLAESGHAVTAYDISPQARESAENAKLDLAANPQAAVREAVIVFTMLPDGACVRALYDEILPAAAPDTLFIDCSTIDVASARAVHAAAKEAGMQMLDAPVSGGVNGAKSGGLTFMVGGEQETCERARPVLRVLGKRTVHCGGPGAGQAAKICNNLILGVSMVAVCEAFVLAEDFGLSAQALFDVASTSSGQCWALNTYCPVPGPVPASPANHGYEPGFSAALMLKDLKLAGDAAARDGATPLAGRAAQLYEEFVSSGHGGEDFSAIIRSIRKKTG
jgi:3-hydroxyisobutyrate dehydrogenase